MNIQVLSGDATQIESDALVTLINSGKMWYGGMDGAIGRTGGNQFHRQAANAIDDGMQDGQALYAPRRSGETKYAAVIFVIDDLTKPVSELVKVALECAVTNGCKQVTLPALRCGVMTGVVEPTPEATIAGIHKGLIEFSAEHPDVALDLAFVVYGQPEIMGLLVPLTTSL